MNHLGTITLETPRLILRKFILSDAACMYKNWANDHEVTRFLTWSTHTSIQDSHDIISLWISKYTNLRTYQWCIELKENHEPIGTISVVHMHEVLSSAEIGYCIGRHFWNKGITSEALAAVIQFLFEGVGVNRIEARHDTNNPGSGKVMLKCGLKYEGTRLMADQNNSGICDVALYGLLARDYIPPTSLK